MEGLTYLLPMQAPPHSDRQSSRGGNSRATALARVQRRGSSLDCPLLAIRRRVGASHRMGPSSHGADALGRMVSDPACILCSNHTLRVRLSTGERFIGELEFRADEMRDWGISRIPALCLAAIPAVCQRERPLGETGRTACTVPERWCQSDRPRRSSSDRRRPLLSLSSVPSFNTMR